MPGRRDDSHPINGRCAGSVFVPDLGPVLVPGSRPVVVPECRPVVSHVPERVPGSAPALVSSPRKPLQASRHHREAVLVAGGQRLVEEQRQRLAALFLRLDPGQAQGEQQLHPGPRRKLRELPRRLLPDIVSDEGPVASKPQVERPGGHVREHVPGPSQDGRLVLGFERLLHVVEQRLRRHREQRFLALVFERLPRPALLGRRLLQLAVRARVVQSGPDLGLELNQARMLVGLDGRRVEIRFQACAFALVGERDESGLLRQPGTDNGFLGARLAQRVARLLPPRKLLDSMGERGAIVRRNSRLGEQALDRAVDLADPLPQ